MSLPSAVRAIGLGDIRVDSALNEPLSAQIDIVGATRDDLAALTAKVANREVFQRYGADRPSFLSSATFKVGLDAQGRPVLNIRSSDAFTDPLVSFLVDLRWGNGELVREYSLLLDPAGFGSSNRAPEPTYAALPQSESPAAPVAVVQEDATATATDASKPAPRATPTIAAVPRAPTGAARAHHRITSHDTLRAIARRSGAHTELAIQRTMIALFRANPHAFDANINRLHLGAVLEMPAADEVEAISAADAKREVRAQMTAWRLEGRPPVVRRVAALPAAATASAPAAQATVAAPAVEPEHVAKEAPNDVAIKNRLQTLEQELDDVHKQLASENARIQDLKHAGEHAAAALAAAQETPPATTVQAADAMPSDPASSATPGWLSGKSLIGTLATGMGLLVAGFVYLRRRKPVIEPHPYDAIAAEEHLAELTKAAAVAETAAVAGVHASVPVAASAPRPSEMAKSEAGRHAAILVTETPAPAPATETTIDLAVDAEALERSYLESIAVDSLGIDTEVLDSGMLETAEHHLSDVHAAAAEDTDIVDPSLLDTAEHDVSGLETIALDASDLDAEMDKEALNTAVLDVKAFNKTVSRTELDYNLLDLDATGQHVEMPSKLHDRVEVSERRTNIADVLKSAIERDPHRRDLRMKLLETYYSAASLNQRAFMEIVRKAARERDYLSAEDWEKVRMMGRDIAAGDPLFNASSKEDDLADCA